MTSTSTPRRLLIISSLAEQVRSSLEAPGLASQLLGSAFVRDGRVDAAGGTWLPGKDDRAAGLLAQRREVREFAAACDCARGQHHAIGSAYMLWKPFADLAWEHRDTVRDETGRPCVQVDPRPELISQWAKECQA